MTDELGVAHALASQRMLADGLRSSPLSPTASTHGVSPAVGHPFAGSFRGRLSCITYGSDGWTEQLRLPVYEHAEVIVDRTKPSATLLVHGGARVEDLVDRFKAGNSVGELTVDFGVSRVELEKIIRGSSSALPDVTPGRGDLRGWQARASADRPQALGALADALERLARAASRRITRGTARTFAAVERQSWRRPGTSAQESFRRACQPEWSLLGRIAQQPNPETALRDPQPSALRP